MEGLTKESVSTGRTAIYDNSMLSSYKECPRKYFLRYGKHWRSEGTAMPLVFGLSWHAGQDIIWQFARRAETPEKLAQLGMAGFLEEWESEGFPADLDMEQIERYTPRTPLVAAEMYLSYVTQRWDMLQRAEILAVEQPFAVPIPNRPDIWYVGRLDKVIEYNGQRLVIEHKTTTAYSKMNGFLSSYTDSWGSDPQVKGYQYGGTLYHSIDQVWVDAALVHKKEHHHFRFIPVAHQFSIIEEWLTDTTNWIERVQMDWERRYFPKNEGSCFGKYGTCTFIDICRTTPDKALPSEPPPGFMIEKWEPFDLLKLEKLNARQQDQSNTSTTV